ncbi:MAG: diguanylate cyclase [Pseudohongiella sp.]|nr:diguanylate cyclase [Pseudohongiella sp.]MDP2127051.1 diguanylate cyclase [Pseudohongiella sp.]
MSRLIEHDKIADEAIDTDVIKSTPGQPGSSSRLLRPGIRASFIIGITVMVLLMLIVTATAIFTSASTTRGVNGIVQEQLPATLSSMRLARAGDALAASGDYLIAVRSTQERSNALARLDQAQQAMNQMLAELTGTVGPENTSQIARLSGEINHNLSNLSVMVDDRLALIEAQRAQRGELQSLLQALQQLATYRVRIVESDSAVMSALAQRPTVPLEQIGEIAARTAPLIPLARFYAQVESIGSRILVAAQDPSLTALSLSEELISTLLNNALATLSRLPPEVADEFDELYNRLKMLAQSDSGLPQLRRRELGLLAQGDIWNAQNQQILAQLDNLTSDLVDHELAAIYDASASVSSVNLTTFWLLLSVAITGVISLAMFFYFHILKDLLARLTFLSQSMQDIAAGQYNVALPPSGADELGRLGAAVQQFHEVAISAALREEKLQTLNRQLAELSISDSLTGLANRRHFDEVLAEEWNRSTRHAHSMAILMIDADHFKAFNDLYGHQAGDDCLQSIAAVIKARVNRPGDLAARYGGEEFSVVLSECDRDGALAVANTIHQAIETLNLQHKNSVYGHITVSIGVASTIPAPTQSAAELLKQADLALYEAKAAGRNRVTLRQVDI